MSDFLTEIGLVADDLTDGREIRCDKCNNVICYAVAEIHALFMLCPKCFGEEKKMIKCESCGCELDDVSFKEKCPNAQPRTFGAHMWVKTD